MTGSIFNRSKRKSAPSWGYSIYVGKDADGKKRFLYASGFALKRDAEEARDKAIAAWKAEQAAATAAARKPSTLAEYMPHWFEQYAERNLTPATVQRYRDLAAFFLPALGPVRLSELSTLLIEREMHRLRDAGGRAAKTGKPKPLAPKTVSLIKGVLSVALNSAVRWGMIPLNPCSLVVMPKAEKREQQALDHQQTDWLLECGRTSWIYPLLLVATATGARRGELCALTWLDVDFDNRLVSISKSVEQTRKGLRLKSTKGKKARIFSLPQSAVQALRDHRTAQQEWAAQVGPGYRADLGIVFADEVGEYRKPDSVTSTACRIAQKAGFTGVSLHNLRHSNGSQLLSAGVPLPVVSARLGHSSPYVTATVYSHALKADEQQAADKWEAARQQAKKEEAARPKN
ncbi:MAG: site-specific integrase [Acidobacteriaceae bacterium]|nr:site-specific integrase [Acidobacteriaceae bacterium]